jgi:hypothetical protein
MKKVLFGLFLLSSLNVWSQSLQEQSMCSKQAKIAYLNEWKDHTKFIGTEPLFLSYESHYNKKLNKCIVKITDYGFQFPGDTESTTTINVYDAFEGRGFAVWQWKSQPNKKYWEVKPITCNLVDIRRNTTYCKTQEEFDKFVNKLMDE